MSTGDLPALTVEDEITTEAGLQHGGPHHSLPPHALRWGSCSEARPTLQCLIPRRPKREQGNKGDGLSGEAVRKE